MPGFNVADLVESNKDQGGGTDIHQGVSDINRHAIWSVCGNSPRLHPESGGLTNYCRSPSAHPSPQPHGNCPSPVFISKGGQNNKTVRKSSRDCQISEGTFARRRKDLWKLSGYLPAPLQSPLGSPLEGANFNKCSNATFDAIQKIKLMQYENAAQLEKFSTKLQSLFQYPLVDHGTCVTPPSCLNLQKFTNTGSSQTERLSGTNLLNNMVHTKSTAGLVDKTGDSFLSPYQRALLSSVANPSLFWQSRQISGLLGLMNAGRSAYLNSESNTPVNYCVPMVQGSANGNSFFPTDLRKPKRIRTAFSPSQLYQLESTFERNHYVVGQERKDLAVDLGLTETQVKVWFQNRRTKYKRMRMEDKSDQLDQYDERAQSPSAPGSVAPSDEGVEMSDDEDVEKPADGVLMNQRHCCSPRALLSQQRLGPHLQGPISEENNLRISQGYTNGLNGSEVP
ncbi:unnamed protein product [Calicophoron daubneyi]|uniref:Homeobox domain-containing protein n=1 Tax=Calicophoron daubneyi TaxID=300641 RepID=A0AAV2TH26_CALDB